ncbi:MAG: hypothetical protein Q8873_04145 [Bacillota bacterium]|nr:hypothetical protein [Bacillota bacterium]
MAIERGGMPGPRESVCIQTEKIYDSCKSKECAEDLRVYFSEPAQSMIDHANNIKLKCAEVLYVDTEVERIQFNKCYYNVSITFYFKVTVEITTGCSTTTCVDGLAIFCKNAMLFGSEGCSYVFTSKDYENANNIRLSHNANMPTAVVETVNPVALDAKLTETCCDCHHPVMSCDCCSSTEHIPGCIGGSFPEGLVESSRKRVYVTLGLFIFIRLQRSTQLLIPSYDFCIPDKNCIGAGCGDDPCSFFEKLDFPIDAFFPPSCCHDEINVCNSCNTSSCRGSLSMDAPSVSNNPFRQNDE